MKKRPFQSPFSDSLREQVYSMVQRSSYNVISFQIDEKRFGNVYLEIQNESRQIRFIWDRGDVYVEKKAIRSSQWSDFFFVSHNNSNERYYDLLLDSLARVLQMD